MKNPLSAVIDTLFGDSIEWDEQDDTTAYITCPGVDSHTSKTGRKDCRLYMSGVPTVFCLHNHCKDACAELTANIRGSLSAYGWEAPPMTEVIRQRVQSKGNNKRNAERVTEQREACFDIHAWPVSEIESGIAAHSLYEQFNTFIHTMFTPNDVVWMGTPFESGEVYSDNFASTETWARRWRNVGPFICPNPFNSDATDRSIKTLSDKRYFVIEGDDCHPDKDINRDRCGAIFKYAMAVKSELKLRAVVDSGNKSLHGWFDYPGDEIYQWCLEVLPAMGADPATMRLAQPVRLPGVIRDNGKEQRLLWISK